MTDVVNGVLVHCFMELLRRKEIGIVGTYWLRHDHANQRNRMLHSGERLLNDMDDRHEICSI